MTPRLVRLMSNGRPSGTIPTAWPASAGIRLARGRPRASSRFRSKLRSKTEACRFPTAMTTGFRRSATCPWTAAAGLEPPCRRRSYAKTEFTSPRGGAKGCLAAATVGQAEEDGLLKRGRRVLAMPDNMSDEKLGCLESTVWSER